VICASAQWWPYNAQQEMFNPFYNRNQQNGLYVSSAFPGYNNFAFAQTSNYGGYPYGQQNNFFAFPFSQSAAAAAVATTGSIY
jgi:hypothetical protein